MNTIYDVIVIGGGAIGLAAAHELGQRQAAVLVLEKFTFLNQEGSSAGFSRQYRVPYPEDYMVQLALDAQPFWQALQQHTDQVLLDKVGTLWFGDPKVVSTEGNIAAAEQALQRKNVPYRPLTAAQVEQEFQFRNLPASYTGIFQPDGASINLALTLRTLLTLNRRAPSVTLRDEAAATAITRQGEVFRVTVGATTYTAKKLVVTPGPYINDILNLLGFNISVTYWEMSSAYFRKLRPQVQYPTWFVFQPPAGANGNEFYGFPGVGWDYPDYIRVAPDFVLKPLSDPSQRMGIPDAQALAYTADWVQTHMTGLDPTPCHTSTCLIALSNLKDKELVLDFAPPYVPGHRDIVVYGTGWAAKFVPLLGKILSDLALDGHTTYDIVPFQLGPKYFDRLL
jgi:glycine/D-amino acid oxidase-like deaminating enzyme